MKKLFPIVFGLLIWLTGLSSAQACYYTPYGFCLPIMQNLFYPKFQTRLQDPHNVMPRYQLPDQVIRWTVPGYSERENLGQPAMTDKDPVIEYSLGYSLNGKYGKFDGKFGGLSLKVEYVIEEEEKNKQAWKDIKSRYPYTTIERRPSSVNAETNEQRAWRLLGAWVSVMDWPKDKRAKLDDYVDFLEWEGPPEGVTEAQLNGMTPQELLDLSEKDDYYQEASAPIRLLTFPPQFSGELTGQYTQSSSAGNPGVGRQDAAGATPTKGNTRGAMTEDAWNKATDTSGYNFAN